MPAARGACAAIALAWAWAAAPTLAQQAPVPSVSQAVVQPLPSEESLQLNAALSRLGRNPRDIDALIDAGNAALAMGDAEAASGFFKRASQVAPKDTRAKAGLAGAMARNGDPFSAIPLFDEAQRDGAQESAIAADRGLAYDLVGDFVSAQRLYRLALAREPDGEVIRRLALSQAIAGDRRGAEATLLPLLRDQDKAAWRTRAFMLAILGQPEEAVRIARTILPANLAEAMAPYLRYMPKLTPAQQAGAANLGNFPRASEIGRDDPRVAQYAPPPGSRRLASADGALVPAGEPLGRADAKKKDKKREREERRLARASASASASAAANAPGVAVARVVPPAPVPARQSQPASPPALAAATKPARSSAPVPVVAPIAPVAAPVPVAPAAGATKSPAPAATSMARLPEVPSSVPAATAQPGFDLARLSQKPPAAPPAPPAPAAAPAPVTRPPVAPAPVAELAPLPPPVPVAPPPVVPARIPPPREDLSSVFSDLGRPETTRAPAPGAVDIRRIKPAEPKVEAAKPAPPSHPSRIWVQLGVGRDRAALGNDWRRLQREAPEAFRGKEAYTSAMGQTNRLLAGPFQTARAANAFLNDLKKLNLDGPFVWTSPAGQVVDELTAPAAPRRR